MRRICEIAAVPTIGTGKNGFEITTGIQVFALCDDGTLWNRCEGITEPGATWSLLPSVPQGIAEPRDEYEGMTK